MVERGEVNQGGDLRIALRTIRRDTSLYRVSFGRNKEQITKWKMYERIFGHKARHGKTKNINGIETHIPGHYDRYPMLPTDQINKILVTHIVALANSTVLMHLESLLQGDLIKASSLQPKEPQAA